MSEKHVLDLVVLVPGKDDRETLDGLLSKRCASLGIRPLRYEILVHPRRDPGCFREGADILSTFLSTAEHALVMFDHEGSGQESRDISEIAADVRQRLRASGWNDRAEVLVLEPELEIWLWTPSPHLDEALGWSGHTPTLRTWLTGKGLWPGDAPKPPRPKEAMRAALREAQVRPSSSIFRRVAERVSVEACTDPGFGRLQDLLPKWFSVKPAGE